MKKSAILNDLYRSKNRGRKKLAVLIDPDKYGDVGYLKVLIEKSVAQEVDLFFVGGSLVTSSDQGDIIKRLKEVSDIPVVLFPGNHMHLEAGADGVLLLSLISGRNSDYLIGQHVLAAPFLKKSNMEILPTGYMLVGNDRNTTVAYISNSLPIPPDKIQIAVCTAMAGEMMGHRLIYLDAGSGAHEPVTPEMIQKVKESIDIPLIVGGGLNTAEKINKALKAGADIIVIGNGVEKGHSLLNEAMALIKTYNIKSDID